MVTSHFVIYADKNVPRSDIERLAIMLEEEYNAFPYQLVSPIKIFVHQTTKSFCETTRVSGHYAGVWKSGVLHLQPVHKLLQRGILRKIVRHELAHLWVDIVSNSRCPEWFAEGISYWYGNKNDLVIEIKYFKNKIFSLQKLQFRGKKSKDSYILSASFILFLTTVYGDNIILEILQTIGKGTDLADAFKMKTKLDFKSLELDWKHWLKYKIK